MFSYSIVTKSLSLVIVRLVLGHRGQPGDPMIDSWLAWLAKATPRVRRLVLDCQLLDTAWS